jgi:hypothetical protein
MMPEIVASTNEFGFPDLGLRLIQVSGDGRISFTSGCGQPFALLSRAMILPVSGFKVAGCQFHEAVQPMYRYNRSGADFFRRKLNIGYNKATAYVEQLEDLGFIGPQKGTAAREIIKSWDYWIEQLKGNGVSWDEEDELYHNPVGLRQ